MSAKSSFLERLNSGRPLISDGAMGTLLHQRGVSFEQSFDELSLTNPALVAEIHREYIDAGSNIIQTPLTGAPHQAGAAGKTCGWLKSTPRQSLARGW